MKLSDDLTGKSFAELVQLWDDLDLGIDISGNRVPRKNPKSAVQLFLDELLDTPQQRLAKLHQAEVDAAFKRWLDAADIQDLARCYSAVTQGAFDKEAWLTDNPLKQRREATPIPLKDDNGTTDSS